MAFSEIEPFGGTVDDLRAGIGPAITVNINRDKSTKSVAPLDFFPWHEADRKATEAPPEEPAEVRAARIRREVFGLKD